MAYTNLGGVCVIGALMLFNGEVGPTVTLLCGDPVGLLILLGVGVTTFVGVSIYMVLVSQVGCVT